MGTKKNPGQYDCYFKCGLEEPYFVLRANDPLAPVLVQVWAELARRQGEKEAKVLEARTCAEDMKKWLKDHDKARELEHAARLYNRTLLNV